jgi:hypothetical protein
MMLRRHFLRQSAGLLVGMGMVGTRATQANTQSGDLRFEVFRNGSEIGYHVLSFNQNGEQLTVDIDIELRVRFAFVTAYRYEHRNREQWEASELLGFKSRTNDNGTRHSVEARRDDGQLIVQGSEGKLELPVSMLPTTYWHRNFMERDRWIDTQNGRVVESRVIARGNERIEAAGEMVDAERFEVRGDLDVDLWYQDDRWVKLGFTASDGSRIDYRLTNAEAYRFLSFRPGQSSST